MCQVWWISIQRFSLYHVHILISLKVHCDLELWPVTSKINRVYSLTMDKMSAKFEEETQTGLVYILLTSLFPYKSIVTLTFDLGPPKSIGFILTLWLTCLPSSMKHTTVQYRVHKLISIYVNCDLDLWPQSIGSSSPLSEHVCLVWWRGTQQFNFYRVHKVKVWQTQARTDGTTAGLLYPWGKFL